MKTGSFSAEAFSGNGVLRYYPSYGRRGKMIETNLKSMGNNLKARKKTTLFDYVHLRCISYMIGVHRPQPVFLRSRKRNIQVKTAILILIEVEETEDNLLQKNLLLTVKTLQFHAFGHPKLLE